MAGGDRRIGLPRALPPLKGLAWWAFLAVWLTVLGLTLAGAGLYAFRQMSIGHNPAQLYGLQVGTDSARPNIVRFAAGEEALRAGVRPGDRVIAIDGQPTQGEGAVARTLRRMGLPDAATFTMVSSDGRTARHRLTRDPDHYDRSLGGSGLTLAASRAGTLAIQLVGSLLIPLALAVLLLLRRARDPLAPWASLMLLIYSLGLGTPSYWYISQPSAWSWVAEIALPLAGWSQIAVLALFPDARLTRGTWTVLLATLPLAWFMRVESSVVETNTASLVGLTAAVALVVAHYRAMPPGVARQQIRWTLFGFGAGLVAHALLIVDQSLLESNTSPIAYVWYIIAQALLNGVANLCLLVAIAVGLLRYRLYDADAAISRSVTLGALTLLLLAVFASSQKLIEALGEQFFGGSLGAIAGALSAGIAAALIVPLHQRVTQWAERRFQGALVRMRKGLPLLVGDLRETKAPAELAAIVLDRVEAGVRAKHGAVIVDGDPIEVRGIGPGEVRTWLAGWTPAEVTTALDCDREEPRFPMRVPLQADGVERVGWLILGPRPDGSFYGKEEREALAEIADPLARALAISLQRERSEANRRRREARRQKDVGALRRLLVDLQERMARLEGAVPARG